MNVQEKQIYDELIQLIKYNKKDFSLESLPHREQYSAVYGFLESIVDRVGCSDYLFIISITKLEERYGQSLVTCLWEILDNFYFHPQVFRKDIAFAAMYNLVHHYYRRYDVEELRKLLTAYSPYFQLFDKEFPLCYEFLERYCLVNADYGNQLRITKLTLKRLEQFGKQSQDKRLCHIGNYVQTGNNVAIKIGYTSSICSILEYCYLRENFHKTDIVKQSDLHELTREELEEVLDGKDDKIDLSLIDSTEISLAEEYVEEAINYNPDYPKYYFLKAKLKFYSNMYLGLPYNFELRSEIQRLLEKAQQLENPAAEDYRRRLFTYEQFQKTVDDFSERKNRRAPLGQRAKYLRDMDKILNYKACPSHQYRPEILFQDGDYVFISYSTRDFKQVYCDILEMQRSGIKYWYDKDAAPGADWRAVIDEKIKNSKCVLCYLSNNYVLSEPVLRELKYAHSLNKPILSIDLTGKKRITQIIADIARESNESDMRSFSSDMLATFTTIFDDNITVISRDKEPEVFSHMPTLRKALAQKFPKVLCDIRSESGLWKNDRKYKFDGEIIEKPNEDYLIANNEYNLYIVADGISRKAEEYRTYRNSIASSVSKLFCEQLEKSVVEKMKREPKKSDIEELLKTAFNEANKNVQKLLDEDKNYDRSAEKPGCVGVVALIYDYTLYFGVIGDCMGILMRNNHHIVFGEKQTTYVFEKLGLEQNRKILYEDYVNIPGSDYGYGVVNGNESASEYFKTSHIDLEDGDIIYLVSDGISDYILFNKPQKLADLTIDELCYNSSKQDRSLKKQYCDDKAMIKITVGNISLKDL